MGRVLDALASLGVDRETWIMVVGDHGQGLGDHGLEGHGTRLWEEQVRVPLVLRGPDRRGAGARFRAPVSMVDLAPTLLSLLGISPLGGTFPAGRDIAPFLRDPSRADPEPDVFLFRRLHDPGRIQGTPVAGIQVGVVRGRWKLIVGPDEGLRELYDLRTDPSETLDVYSKHRGIARRLEESLAPLLRSGRPVASPLREEDREALRSLGYVD